MICKLNGSLCSEIPIFNAASIKFVTYTGMTYGLQQMVREIHSANQFGIPNMTFTECVYYAWMIRIFRCLIPALIVDGIANLMGGKPR